MFSQHLIEPKAFALRFVELLPEYLPGMDTGAFEPTDRQRCWNKTLKSVLTVIGKEYDRIDVAPQASTMTHFKEQASLLWQQDGAPLFAMTTGWGTRSELETCIEWLESFKCPQKLFVYSCSKWKEAVAEQICAALLRYPYHIEGEQYLFMNLIGAENRFHLLDLDLKKSGRQPSAHDILLRPVPGSPFSWRTNKTKSE